MSFRYHALCGINDESLRQVYLNSLPVELQGHYTKQYPNKKVKSAKLIHQLKQIADEVPSDVDIESIFLKQEDVDSHTTFVLQDFDSSSESSEYSDPDFLSEAYQAANKDYQQVLKFQSKSYQKNI
ncbi:hypothetical protein Ddye_008739 [Dipteronia dyeriana]|uniref:Uncharacterized protein n=1 Tax=Dipteronia dyeriana TaxID=168575 RepID=A0AAD9XAD6_9ROSI|nr:hypothetical protein Ddye_008739 [Dipteronia dyeriana]